MSEYISPEECKRTMISGDAYFEEPDPATLLATVGDAELEGLIQSGRGQHRPTASGPWWPKSGASYATIAHHDRRDRRRRHPSDTTMARRVAAAVSVGATDHDLAGTVSGDEGIDQNPERNGRLLSIAVARSAPQVAAIVKQLGLAGKTSFTARDRDSIAARLMGAVMEASGKPPGWADANLARKIVDVSSAVNGVKIDDGTAGGTYVSGDEVGFDFWKVSNPLWLTGKLVQGAGWALEKTGMVAKKLGRVATGGKWGDGGGGGGTSPTSSTSSAVTVHRSALIAAGKRRAAAKARILAAEKRHEAAILQREEARRAAQADADAADAEAAANEAEVVALDAQTQQNVADTEAVEGADPSGYLQPMVIAGLIGGEVL